MSYVHEPPKYPPLCYSNNYFNDVLPSPLMDWFRKHAIVSNLTKSSNGWICKYGEELKPGSAIIIDFDKCDTRKFGIYFLFESKVIKYDDASKYVESVQTLPDSIPSSKYFNAWVYQSIYNNVFDELYNSSCIGSTYLTKSPFISELINKDISHKNTFESDIANLALKLDLPIINNSSIEKIMYVRNNDGEAFKNFRVELRRQLKTLRQINDTVSLKYALENVTQELNEVQVNQVNIKFNQIRRSIFADAGAFLASLASTLQTNGFSLLFAATSLAKGFKDYSTYISTVKENPGYFLWRLKK